MKKILIADDNRQITSILADYAQREGYLPLIAYDGAVAIDKFEAEKPEIVLLDVAMPEKDGFQVCREIRQRSNVPIIMITARGEDFEKIMGLEIGADDYIVKPFPPGEVMARIRAVMRRLGGGEKADRHFVYDNLSVNLEDYTVKIGGDSVPLTKKEIEILWTLAVDRNRVFTRENLLNSLWGFDYYGDLRTVDSHIKRMRAKLDRHPHPAWEIKTIWGVGYKFEALEND